MAKRARHITDAPENVPVKHVVGYDTVVAECGKVPGGFGQVFRRTWHSGIFQSLSESARILYSTMAVLAEPRKNFELEAGVGELAKWSGLGRSTVERTLRDELVPTTLVEIIYNGKWTPESGFERNIYRMRVPAEHVKVPRKPKKKREPMPDAEQTLCPPRSRGCAKNGAEGLPAKRREAMPSGRALLKKREEVQSNSRDAAVLLVEHGVDPNASLQLAAEFPFDRILDAIDTMKYRRSKGKCDNPGGLIRDFLVRNWELPTPVARAREEEARRRAAEERARQDRLAERSRLGAVSDEEARVDSLIDSLPDDELHVLAQSVFARYEGNAAVTAVLTKKPIRQCRLMKMEIAAMLAPK